jgi:molybdate transport system regulatory protein
LTYSTAAPKEGAAVMEIKHKFWLEKEGRVVFGYGRLTLLNAIMEFHSLHTAAKKLNMSYRAAWGRLKASEERLGIKLVETHAGVRGMALTNEGKTLLTLFDELEQGVDTYIRESGRKLSMMINVDATKFLFFHARSPSLPQEPGPA